MIRAALYNHGGSVITHGISLDLEGQDVYSSQIGNDYHLDLVEAERIILVELNHQQREALLEWASGISEEQSADLKRIKPSALRKRRQRAVEKLTVGMGDDEPDG